MKKKQFNYLVIFLIVTILIVTAALVVLFAFSFDATIKTTVILAIVFLYLIFLFMLKPRIEMQIAERNFGKLIEKRKEPIKVNLDFKKVKKILDRLNFINFQTDHNFSINYLITKTNGINTIYIINLIFDINLDFNNAEINLAIDKLEKTTYQKHKYKSYSIVNVQFVNKIDSENILDANQVIFLKRGSQHLTQINILVAATGTLYFLENTSFYPTIHYRYLCNLINENIEILN